MIPALDQQFLLTRSLIAAVPHCSAASHVVARHVGDAGLDGLFLFAAAIVADGVSVTHGCGYRSEVSRSFRLEMIEDGVVLGWCGGNSER